MKLGDLINALADEIDIIRPELAQHLETISSPNLSEDDFQKSAQFYAQQVERMGEAAEMVGFPGLQDVCNHVIENIRGLALTAESSAREPFIDFLKKWPELSVQYLHNLEDPSAAAGIIDLLSTAPVPTSQDDNLKIMHNLGAFPSAMDSMEQDDTPQRPVLVSPQDIILTVPEDVDQSLLEGFYQEAPGQAEHLVALLNNMLTDEGDVSDVVAAKRIVHTFKGTGAIIGLTGLSNLGHHFEDILEYFEKQGGEVNPKIATILLDGAHCIAQIIAYLTGNDDHPDQIASVMQSILDIANIIDRKGDFDNVLLRGQSINAAPQIANAEAKIPAGGASSVKSTALRVSTEHIEKLFQVSAEVSVHSAAMEAQIKVLTDNLKRLHSQHLKVKKRLFELETVVDVRSLAVMHNDSHTARSSDSIDPLELEQYNELHSTTHALLEEFNDIIIIGDESDKSLTELITLENRQMVLSRDLQNLVIGTRMSEVGSLESRLQRNIRTTCQMTEKQARLVFEGGHTLIDSDILGQLADPLLHLLRNAVDHGIETPEERKKLGKDPVGTITLTFEGQGQQVVLTCKDDGKGIDYDAVLKRAIEKNLVSESDNPSKDEIGLLMFKSGFSTRDAVSQVSGRGVGLDVVSDWVNKMNGDIEVTSEEGQGTAMSLSFASSLTTVQSLIVGASKQAFALPSVQIVQALSHDEGQFVESGNSIQYRYNDKVYGAKYLSDLLGFERSSDIEKAFAILVRVQGEIWALAVDSLIDSRELLLKPAGMYVKHVPAIVGTSILGDGSIAIHVDLAQLFDKGARRRSSRVESSETNYNLNQSIKKAFVVDDSLSVRTTLKELLEDAGFDVTTAKDGLEAVNILNSYKPDFILTDLEMPNMNGIEFTSHVRNRADLTGMPIIMVTSRSQDKHREMANNAGVDDYFTKPYNDIELLKAIERELSKV